MCRSPATEEACWPGRKRSPVGSGPERRGPEWGGREGLEVWGDHHLKVISALKHTQL